MYFADRFADAMKNGGRALFLGVKHEQIPEEYRTHPRLIFWDSDSPQIKGANFQELPVRTKVVVATRWLGHAPYEKAQMFARRGNVLFMGKLSSTGEIAKMLHEALPVSTPSPVADSIDIHKAAADLQPMDPAAVPEPPVPAPAVELFPTPDPGTEFQSVSACIRFYAQREVERPVVPGKRHSLAPSYLEGLAARVRAHGFDSDPVRVQQCLFNLRSVWRARVEREQERAARAAEAATPPVVETAIVLPPPPPPEPLPANLDQLVGWADELELKAITAVELADQLRRVVREHRDLREVKEKYDALLAVMQGGAPKMNGTASASHH